MSPKTMHVPEPGNEAPAINENEVAVVLKLAIPPDLYTEYERSALGQGLTPTELIMHRLKRCRDHNGLRPLYFSDTQRQQLETLLQKKPLETAEQVLALLNANLSVQLGEMSIQLSAQQLKRISMGGYAGQSAEQRFAQVVVGAISKAYGV